MFWHESLAHISLDTHFFLRFDYLKRVLMTENRVFKLKRPYDSDNEVTSQEFLSPFKRLSIKKDHKVDNQSNIIDDKEYGNFMNTTATTNRNNNYNNSNNSNSCNNGNYNDQVIKYHHNISSNDEPNDELVSISRRRKIRDVSNSNNNINYNCNNSNDVAEHLMNTFVRRTSSRPNNNYTTTTTSSSSSSSSSSSRATSSRATSSIPEIIPSKRIPLSLLPTTPTRIFSTTGFKASLPLSSINTNSSALPSGVMLLTEEDMKSMAIIPYSISPPPSSSISCIREGCGRSDMKGHVDNHNHNHNAFNVIDDNDHVNFNDNDNVNFNDNDNVNFNDNDNVNFNDNDNTRVDAHGHHEVTEIGGEGRNSLTHLEYFK